MNAGRFWKASQLIGTRKIWRRNPAAWNLILCQCKQNRWVNQMDNSDQRGL
jgi:hypothetical protein